ncbi:hydrogenase expression/formation protein HypE [Candidatus Poribacteria bacterium]|nr:hydrogenase expression/formation protein HypE [Candidatus Poribacteria bacterium]
MNAKPLLKTDKVLLAHGSGSKASHDLVAELFLQSFSNPALDQLNDGAVLEIPPTPLFQRGERGDLRLAYTTDSYVIDPIFFPGGDIGKLAVCGTVNDLAMSGATPFYLSVGFIIEEGLEIDILRKVVASMQQAAEEANVKIVTGDTKVVNRGHADKLFINTSGIGFLSRNINISGNNATVGDKVIVSGSIGEHGIAVMSRREGLEFDAPITSDCAPLNSLVTDMLSVTTNIHCLRDPTRGGLATTLNELATQSNVGILIDETKIPIKEPVRGACELLGYDALYVANEGKLVAIVPEVNASQILMKMRENKYGRDSKIIGEVITEPKRVLLKTVIGGTRIVDMLAGELLPRIC